MDAEKGYEKLLTDIAAAAQEIKQLKQVVYEHYSVLVGKVLADRITDEADIEKIMDGLTDFGEDIEFLDLYRKICRHVYYYYPQLVGEHVALFRSLFMTNDEETEG